MKKKLQKMTSGLCTATLALLGFSSCDHVDPWGGEMLLEYGTPNMHFRVKGTVTDKNKKPLKGIRVVVKDYYNHDNGSQADTTFTDAKGSFESKKVRVIGITNTKLVVEDIDGEENGGSFKSVTKEVDKLNSKQVAKGDNRWYGGEHEYSADIQLEKESE